MTAQEESEAVRRVADLYRRRGYRVTIAPTAERLPAFLRDFRPDLLAEGTDEFVVVEVKVRDGDSQADRWAQLAQVVREHPGWRLDVAAGIDLDPTAGGPATQAEIADWLQQAHELVHAGRREAALLIVWAGLEAAMRRAAARHDVELPDQRPATLIGRLYAEGVIDREQFSLLRDKLLLRNRVAHGFRDAPISDESIARLEHVASALAA